MNFDLMYAIIMGEERVKKRMRQVSLSSYGGAEYLSPIYRQFHNKSMKHRTNERPIDRE